MTFSFSGLLERARTASARDRALILACLALVSALLSNFVSVDPWQILRIRYDKFIDTPLLPGLYFGLVLAAGVYLWVSTNAFNCIAVLVLTMAAWILAHQTAIQIFQYHDELARQIQGEATAQFNAALEQYRDLLAKTVAPDKMPEISAPSIRAVYPFALVIGGFFAGLVGSTITAFGVSVASPDFRTVANWTRTLLIGTVAGVLLQLIDYKIVADISIIAVFFVWQPAVAASIGYGLRRTAPRATR
jgi:hypothetical protein